MYLGEFNDSKVPAELAKLNRKTRDFECLLDLTKNGISFEEIVNYG